MATLIQVSVNGALQTDTKVGSYRRVHTAPKYYATRAWIRNRLTEQNTQVAIIEALKMRLIKSEKKKFEKRDTLMVSWISIIDTPRTN